MPKFTLRDTSRISTTVRRFETNFDDKTNPRNTWADHVSMVPVVVYNTTSETIKPFAVCAVKDAKFHESIGSYVRVEQPGDDSKVFLVNGPSAIETKTYGEAFASGAHRVRLDSADYEVGDQLYAKSNEWTATTDGSTAIGTLLGVIDETKKFGLVMLGGTSDPLELYQLTSTLNIDDQTATGYRVLLGDAAPDESEEVTLHNTNNQFFGLPGESIQAVTASGYTRIVGHGAVHVWGKLESILTRGGTATFSVWKGGYGYEMWSEDSGIDLTVKAPPSMKTGSIPIGEWVRVNRAGNYVDMAGCWDA